MQINDTLSRMTSRYAWWARKVTLCLNPLNTLLYNTGRTCGWQVVSILNRLWLFLYILQCLSSTKICYIWIWGALIWWSCENVFSQTIDLYQILEDNKVICGEQSACHTTELLTNPVGFFTFLFLLLRGSVEPPSDSRHTGKLRFWGLE